MRRPEFRARGGGRVYNSAIRDRQNGNPGWNLLRGYGGGDIAEWSRTIPNGDYWSRLDGNIAGNRTAYRNLVANLRSGDGQRNVHGHRRCRCRDPTTSAGRHRLRQPTRRLRTARDLPEAGHRQLPEAGRPPGRNRRCLSRTGASRSYSTRGSSHPQATARAAQVPPVARPSARSSGHSIGGASCDLSSLLTNPHCF